MARGSSSIARFDPVTPTAALRDAPTDGWVLWWWSAFSADHRLHAAISPPSVPTEAMESAGSMLKGWDLTDLGKPRANPFTVGAPRTLLGGCGNQQFLLRAGDAPLLSLYCLCGNACTPAAASAAAANVCTARRKLSLWLLLRHWSALPMICTPGSRCST